MRDLKSSNPCVPYTKETISASSIMFDGKEYKQNGTSFYEFKKEYNAWAEIEDNDLLQKLRSL
jgi:hypothetical protein